MRLPVYRQPFVFFILFSLTGSCRFSSCLLLPADRFIQRTTPVFSFFLSLHFLTDQAFQDFLKFEDLIVICSTSLYCILLFSINILAASFVSFRISSISTASPSRISCQILQNLTVYLPFFLRWDQCTDCFQLKSFTFQLIYFKKKLDIKRCIIAMSQFIASQSEAPVLPPSNAGHKISLLSLLRPV